MTLNAKIKVLCIGLSLAALIGCAQKTVPNTLKELTSKAINGRMYGTKGNEKAGIYLQKQLKNIGVDALADEFAIPFTAQLPSDITYDVEIKTVDGSVKLSPGEHFTPILSRKFGVNGKLCEGENSNELLAIDELGAQTVIIQEYVGKSNANFYETPTKMLYVTKAGMELLRENIGNELIYSCAPKADSLSLDNIFGVQKGMDSKIAIVIGAHFDDTAAADDTTQGAIDNASGVAAVLEVAQRLKGAKLPCDIVYTFWNAEEASRTGSRVGRTELDSRYEAYCYLNIDCVGFIGGGPVEVSTANGEQPISQDLAQLLLSKGYKNAVSSDEIANTDHTNFSDIVNVNFAQTYTNMPFHTPLDKLSAVDERDIEAFAKALADVILSDGTKLIDYILADKENSSENNDIDMFQQEGAYKKTLATDEMIYLSSNNINQFVESESATNFESIDTLQTLYPNVDISQSFYDKDFKIAEIYSAIAPTDFPEKPKNKAIYKRGFSAKDAYSINAVYADSAGKALRFTLMPTVTELEDYIKNSYANNYEAIKGAQNAWCVDEGGIYVLFFSANGVSYKVQTGSLIKAEGQILFGVDTSATKASILENANTWMEKPLVVIK